MKDRLFLMSCLVASLPVVGCFIVPDGIVCTELFAYGVSAHVVDEAGVPVSGATLTLTEGEYSETLMEVGAPQDGTYLGAGERAGTYTLTVEADGFETATVENLFVDEDECHVLGVNVDVTLTAIPG